MGRFGKTEQKKEQQTASVREVGEQV